MRPGGCGSASAAAWTCAASSRTSRAVAWRTLAVVLAILPSLGTDAAARPWRWQRRIGSGNITTIVAGTNGTVYACGELVDRARSGARHSPVDAVQIEARSGRIRWRGQDWGRCANVAVTT